MLDPRIGISTKMITGNNDLWIVILNRKLTETKKAVGEDCFFVLVVRMKGLEPPRREAPDPKSGAATNYATSASRSCLGLQR